MKHMDDLHIIHTNTHVNILKYRTRTAHIAMMYYTQGGQTHETYG